MSIRMADDGCHLRIGGPAARAAVAVLRAAEAAVETLDPEVLEQWRLIEAVAVLGQLQAAYGVEPDRMTDDG